MCHGSGVMWCGRGEYGVVWCGVVQRWCLSVEEEAAGGAITSNAASNRNR